MAEDFDLFGLPVPEGRGKRGRPAHLVTKENISKVNMLLAFGRTNEEIALALGISEPTLRKNYFHLLSRRLGARLQAEAWLLEKLAGEVDAGNVAAMKEVGRRLEKHDLVVSHPRAPKPEKVGKKEQALRDAHLPDADTPLGRLMLRRQGSVN